MMRKETHDKIQSLFFDNPSRGFKLRELSREASIAPASLYTYLEHFINRTVVKVVEEYGLKLYKANTESEIYKQDKIAYNIQKIQNSKIIDEINKKFDYPCIILFGSKSKGEDNEKSDIDIAIISTINAEIDTNKYENSLNSEVNFLVINNFNKLAAEIKNNIINGKILSGYLEVY